MSDFNQIILIDMVVCRVPGVDWCHAPAYCILLNNIHITSHQSHQQYPIYNVSFYCIVCCAHFHWCC